MGLTEIVGRGAVAVDTALLSYFIEEHPRFLAPVRVVDLSRDQLRTAARLRARYGGPRTPDAPQLAAAISTGCQAFVTKDRRMPEPDGLRVRQLSEFA